MGLFDLFSTKPAEAAARARQEGLRKGFGEAEKYITEGTNTASGYYDRAAGLYDPLISGARSGYDAYGRATGAYGPEAQQQAYADFQTSPGYQFAVDQGLEAAKRASGGVYSGNLLDELVRRGQGYANQEFGNYVSRLSPYLSVAPQVTGGQAGILTGQGGLYQTQGQQLGNYGWQKETGIGQAQADAEMSKYAAAGNLLGAITGGASLVGKALGAPIPSTSILGRAFG